MSSYFCLLLLVPHPCEKGNCSPSSTNSDNQKSRDSTDFAVKCLWVITSSTTSGKCPDFPRPQFPHLLNGVFQASPGHCGAWWGMDENANVAVTGCTGGIMPQIRMCTAVQLMFTEHLLPIQAGKSRWTHGQITTILRDKGRPFSDAFKFGQPREDGRRQVIPLGR